MSQGPNKRLFNISAGPKSPQEVGKRLGCVLPLAFSIVIVILILVLLENLGVNMDFNKVPSTIEQEEVIEITESTVKRDPLDVGLVIETEYFTDEIGWIKDASAVQEGMEYFYSLTGVQPHLYIIDSLNGDDQPILNNMLIYSENLYDTLFEDEAHLLVLAVVNERGVKVSSFAGNDAAVIMDEEAANIIRDYVKLYYSDEVYTPEKFSAVFSDAADTMMAFDPPITRYVWIGVGVILVLYTILGVIRGRQRRKAFMDAAQQEE